MARDWYYTNCSGVAFVARGSVHRPGLIDLDTSLFKKFTVGEKLALQFRAKVFNVFNHADFSYPNQIVFRALRPAHRQA